MRNLKGPSFIVDMRERLPCGIRRMKQFMSLMGIWLSKETGIQLLYLRVVVRLPKRLTFILSIKSSGSLLLVRVDYVGIFIGQEAFMHKRLASSIDTTTGTSHYFYEGILGLAFTYLLKDLQHPLRSNSAM